ncbi:hypothetical protein JCM8097_008580 [Rhodosporidiobolus ruineniae]
MLRTSARRALPQGFFHATPASSSARVNSSPHHPPFAQTLALAAFSGVAGIVLYTQVLGGDLSAEQEPGKAFNVASKERPQVHLQVHFLVLVHFREPPADCQTLSYSWGRNTHAVASPSSSSAAVKKPSPSPALSDLVLRDLALSATYGCAIDSEGNALQWGHGYGGANGAVERTAVGKDLVQIRPTEEGKVFGLSKKGEVYVWASDKLRQRADAVAEDVQRPSGSGFFGRLLPWGGNGNDNGVQVLTVGTDVKLEKGERFVSLSSGKSHLLALTSAGRSFALPLSLSANTHGQLGVRSVTLLAPPHLGSSATSGLSVRLEPDERLNEMTRDTTPVIAKNIDPWLLNNNIVPTPENPSPKPDRLPPPPGSLVFSSAIQLHPSADQHTALERSPSFCTTLHEIPALKGIQVVELVAGKNHSLARLGGALEGRVLGWGGNAFGQLGLGATLTYPSIPTPTEIPLTSSPSYAVSGSSNRPTSVKCERIAAGGNVSYFVVKATGAGGFNNETQDLLASGQGQYGGIGNGLWAHATLPVRVKGVSLSEWNEKSGRTESIKIKDVQAGDGHVAVVLDNAITHPSGVTFGRDVLVWGQNDHYQLGTGKRSNLPTPQHLAALPASSGATSAKAASGSSSPASENRLQLAVTLPTSPTLLALNRGLGRKSRIEEAIVAGDGGTGVYWRVANP